MCVEILTDSEVQSLLSCCSRRAPTGVRNRALVALLYRSGLRISEALRLMPGEVDMEARLIRVADGKGHKARTVGVDRGALEVLAVWMERRVGLGFNGRHPVFCTLKGGRVSADYVRQMLPRLGRRAGLTKRVHAHGLRHTMASQLAMEGVPMNVIQAQLGHTSLAVTGRYLAHIMPADLVRAMGLREWKANAEK